MNTLVRISSWMIVFLLIGAAVCMVAFNIIGSEVDAEGYLREPFFLIPLFWLFIFTSLVIGVINIGARVIRARRNVNRG